MVQAVLIVQALIFHIAFGIAALVIASQWLPAPPCALNSTFLTLSAWLLGFGVSGVVIGGATVFLVIAMDQLMTLFQIWTAISALFLFAWMIVGSVALWRDDWACQTAAYPLWAMSAAAVISMYINMGVNCIIIPIARKSATKD